MQTYSVYLNGLLWATGMELATAFALTLDNEIELEAEKDRDNG